MIFKNMTPCVRKKRAVKNNLFLTALQKCRSVSPRLAGSKGGGTSVCRGQLADKLEYPEPYAIARRVCLGYRAVLLGRESGGDIILPAWVLGIVGDITCGAPPTGRATERARTTSFCPSRSRARCGARCTSPPAGARRRIRGSDNTPRRVLSRRRSPRPAP